MEFVYIERRIGANRVKEMKIKNIIFYYFALSSKWGPVDELTQKNRIVRERSIDCGAFVRYINILTSAVSACSYPIAQESNCFS